MNKIKGTFIEEIINHIPTDISFLNEVKDKYDESMKDRCLGELNELELAILSLASIELSKKNTLYDSIKKQTKENGKDPGENEDALRRLDARYETLKELFWILVKDRVGYQYEGIFYTAEGKIVRYSDEQIRRDRITQVVNSLFGGGPRGIEIEVIHL